MSTSNLFPRGLRATLVILVIIGVVIAVTVVGFFRAYSERHRIMEDVRREGQERVGLVAEAVANLVIGYDYTNLESLAERIVSQEDVQDIVVRNKEGKIMVSRNRALLPGETGLSFQAPVYFGGEQIGQVDMRVSLRRLDKQLAEVYENIVAVQIFFGLFLGLLIYFAASIVIVRPIVKISSRMKSIVNSQEIAPPEKIEVPGHGEIADLAGAFNDLTQKVYNAQQRLREKIDMAGTALMKSNEQLQTRSTELEQRTKELEKAISLVELLAVTDSLTEMRNRRYFDDALAAAFARAQRFQEPLCLMLLDIDKFKQINDTLGHGAGDAVLAELASIIKSRTRETDVAARLGGDEFALLLYRTNKEEARKLAENLLGLVHQNTVKYGDQTIRIELSIGIASIVDAPNSIESLYGSADEALYEAKRRGRNQAVMYPFSMATTS